MTNDEAKRMLTELSAHFGVPVMPVTRFCDAFRTWDRVRLEQLEPGSPQWRKMREQIQARELDIRKSNLLWRLIYGGEELRTERCPEHNGRWIGLPSPFNDCEHGCDLTGWIRNGFVRPQPGEPCRHKWRMLDPQTKRQRCYHCKELLK